MSDLKHIQDMMWEVARSVIPDPECKACVFYPYVSGTPLLGSVSCPDRLGAIVLCGPCATRKPYAWVADLDPADVKKHADSKTGAWCIDELRVLLVPARRRGWEFL